MDDQRGRAIRELAGRPGPRRYWHFADTDGDWLFECVRYRGEWWCVRQIHPGRRAYDWRHLEDEDGFLTDQPLGDDAPGEPIPKDEFERVWRAASRP
jgi:hypothetical protein